MRFYLETERLILRDLVPEDYRAAFLWCGDPDVARYMVYPVYTREEDVKTWLESRDLDDPDKYDAGIVLKATGELIGSGGLFYEPENDLWTIGYNIRKDQWGNGYVPEAIRAIIEYVSETSPTPGIRAISSLIEMDMKLLRSLSL